MRAHTFCFVKPCIFSITRIGYSLALLVSATAMYYFVVWENISHWPSSRLRGEPGSSPNNILRVGLGPRSFKVRALAPNWTLCVSRDYRRFPPACHDLWWPCHDPNILFCTSPLEVYFCWEDRRLFSSCCGGIIGRAYQSDAGKRGDQSVKSSSLTHCRRHTNSSYFCRFVLLLSKQYEYQ